MVVDLEKGTVVGVVVAASVWQEEHKDTCLLFSETTNDRKGFVKNKRVPGFE